MPHMSKDEMKVAIFTNVVALSSVMDAILEVIEESSEEFEATSRLRFFARRRLRREQDQLYRLFRAVHRVKERNDK